MSGFFDPPLAARQPLPYTLDRGMQDGIAAHGRAGPASGSRGEADDRTAARIDAASSQGAAPEPGRSAALDAVFACCTSPRLLQAVGGSEAEPGKPVTSSNHALAWRCVRRAGIAGGRPVGGAPDERP